MSNPVCIIAGATFLLMDFQGHVLDLAGSVNPIITYPQNSPLTANQQWLLSPSEGGWIMSNSLPGNVVSWSTSLDGGSAQYMQAMGMSSTTLGFNPTCVNSTYASWIQPSSGYALTAWPVEDGSNVAPVTYEPYTGRAEQFWTIVAVDSLD
ncbi:hypothetical protein K438DRAFT_1772545 [Mycena galopus ATCC 62051]|nr:hypothetical protein K438DRAFT_1772545 [Mycena galopus ATCC 62051]